MDPLADLAGQDRFSPYAAMGDDPVDGTNPGGTVYRSVDNNDCWVTVNGHYVPDLTQEAKAFLGIASPPDEDYGAYFEAYCAEEDDKFYAACEEDFRKHLAAEKRIVLQQGMWP